MIEVISGTNRPGSNSLKLAQILVDYYKELGTEARILDLQDMPAELFDPKSYAEKPAGWSATTDRILAADGLHIVTPEYNGSFPGVLKYFIDMLPFPESFEHRCVAFTGHGLGMWGAIRAVEQLQMIFGYRNACILPERVWYPAIHTRIDEEGRLKDEVDAERLKNQAIAFDAWVKRFKN